MMKNDGRKTPGFYSSSKAPREKKTSLFQYGPNENSITLKHRTTKNDLSLAFKT